MLYLPSGINIQLNDALKIRLAAYLTHIQEAKLATLLFEPLKKSSSGPICHPIEVQVKYIGDKWFIVSMIEFIRLRTTHYEHQENLYNFNFEKKSVQLFGCEEDEIHQLEEFFNNWQKHFFNYIVSDKYRVVLFKK